MIRCVTVRTDVKNMLRIKLRLVYFYFGGGGGAYLLSFFRYGG